MCGTGRLEVYVLDAGLGERVAEFLYPWPFDRASRQEEQLDLLIECSCVGKSAATARLRIERSPEAAAIPAEAAEICELVKIEQPGSEGLHATHRETRHGAVFPARSDSVVLLNHWNQIGEHHFSEGRAEPRHTSRRRCTRR